MYNCNKHTFIYENRTIYEKVLYISENTAMCVNVTRIIILFFLHIGTHTIFNFPTFLYILKINTRIIYSIYLLCENLRGKHIACRRVFLYVFEFPIEMKNFV